jgi:hypothetical protein
VIVAAPDAAVAEMIGLIADEYGLPLFIATSSRPQDVANATPAGDLTQAERDTLEELRTVGGSATVAALAGVIGLAPAAVNNRLSGLEKKGYIHRLPRGRRYGDVFVDPRAPAGDEGLVANALYPDVPPPRTALLKSGIRTDPYRRPRIDLEGEAADRAAEIIRRRRGES